MPEAPSEGGRNLLKNSKSFTGSNITGSSTISSETYQDCAVRYLKSSAWGNIAHFSKCVVPEVDSVYTASFWAKGNGKIRAYFYGDTNYLQVSSGTSNQGASTSSDDGFIDFTLSEDWQRYWVVYKLKSNYPTDDTTVAKHLFLRHPISASEEEIWIAGCKLEEGNIATDYNQAPEDLGWSAATLVPTQTQRYLWKFEYIYYSDGSVEVTQPVNISIAGADGTNGQTSHVHFAFADNATGGGFSLTTPKAYMGWYADFNETASNDPTKYKWGKWKGDQGVAGQKGDDGKTSYLHLAYASSADGKTGFSFTDTKQQYQGYYTDFTQSSSTDPTKYVWVDRLANVKVGGVNLLRKTKKFDWSSFYGSSKLTDETYQGCAVRYFKNTGTSSYQEIVQFSNCIYPTLNGEYVASFWAKGSGTVTTFFYGGANYLKVSSSLTSQGSSDTQPDGRATFTLSENWERYWVKYKLRDTPSEATQVAKHLLFRHNNNSTEEEIWLAGCKLEEGNVPTPYEQSPEDTQADIDSKADQALTQEQLNALAEKNRNMEAEMAAKASLAEIEQWKQAYDAYVAQNDADKTSAEQKLITLTSRVAEWVKDWEDKKVQWSFLDTNMDFGEEGLRLGKKGSPTSILISNDRIGFYSGGSEVASMSNGTLTIDNGIFAKSLQIGHYREEVYEGDKTINVIRWID